MRVDTMQVAPGVRLEYAQVGREDGDVIVFLHGNGTNLRQFYPQLTELGDEYRAVAISLRGYGRSTAPPRARAADFALDVLAADVWECLVELGVSTAHVVGNSMGGLVGFEMIRLDPTGVRSLTTFGTTAELHVSPAALPVLAGTQFVLGNRVLARFVSAATGDARTTAQIRSLFRGASRSTIVNATQNLGDYDYTDDIRAPACPMMIVRGVKDTAIERSLASTLAAAEENGSVRVVTIDEAGHFANLDTPTRFNQTLRRFYASLTEAS